MLPLMLLSMPNPTSALHGDVAAPPVLGGWAADWADPGAAPSITRITAAAATCFQTIFIGTPGLYVVVQPRRTQGPASGRPDPAGRTGRLKPATYVRRSRP